jgi:CRISPR-associated protein Csb1
MRGEDRMTTINLDPGMLLKDDGPLRLTLVAKLRPASGLDRFQPAGFPEIGHVIYDAPRREDGNATYEPVCIVDSAASMANHLEMVCLRAPHDPDLVSELTGLPHVRCVTDKGWPQVAKTVLDGGEKETVVTTFTEGHRLASTYFLGGKRLVAKNGKTEATEEKFEKELQGACKIKPLGKKTHPGFDGWWDVFKQVFRYDPNSLVHGVLFPQWQVKISRVLTAHLEARGARRVDRAGIKFDRLGKTVSGQPIFAVDDEVAHEIRATFVIDLALVRSFGRGKKGDKDGKGLHDKQKELLVALALWKVGRLLRGEWKYRTGCDLECESLRQGPGDSAPTVDPKALATIGMKTYIGAAEFENPAITEIYWPADELYREGEPPPATGGGAEAGGEEDEEEDGEEDDES